MKSYRKPHRIKKRKSILRSRFFWFSVFILLLAGSLFYLIFFSPYFQIKRIEISGSQKASLEEIKNIVDENINRNMVFFVLKDIFSANIKETSKKILEKFPQIKEIKIKRNLPDFLTITIEERIAVGTFCQDSDCFDIDENGVIFEKKENKASPVIKSEVFNPNLILGQTILEKKYISYILEINNNLKRDSRVDIKEFIVSGDGQRLTIETMEGWKVLLNLGGNILDKIYNLELVLKEKIPPEKRKNLDYIDLRFGNRVYYKYR